MPCSNYSWAFNEGVFYTPRSLLPINSLVGAFEGPDPVLADPPLKTILLWFPKETGSAGAGLVDQRFRQTSSNSGGSCPGLVACSIKLIQGNKLVQPIENVSESCTQKTLEN